MSACSGGFYKIPTPDYDATKYTVVTSDTVTTTGVMLFQFIPIDFNEKIQRALENLKAKNGGDALTDITIQESWFWAYILNGYSEEVHATILKKKPPQL